LIAAVLLLLLRWLENPDARTLYAIFFCFGLALANHMASLLVALVLMPYLLWRTPRWRERASAVAIAVLTTALLYLYLPIRYSAQPEFNLIARYFDRDLRDPADILWMLSGQMFGAEMFAYPPLEWLGEIARFVGELWRNFLGVGLLVGVVGVYRLWTGNRVLSLLLAGVFGAQVLFFTSYRVFDKWTMFHTAYLVWSVYVAVGFTWLSERLAGRWISASLGLLVAVQVALNWNVSGAPATTVQNRTQELLGSSAAGDTDRPWTTLRRSNIPDHPPRAHRP
jgi:hypothetical protein